MADPFDYSFALERSVVAAACPLPDDGKEDPMDIESNATPHIHEEKVGAHGAAKSNDGERSPAACATVHAEASVENSREGAGASSRSATATEGTVKKNDPIQSPNDEKPSLKVSRNGRRRLAAAAAERRRRNRRAPACVQRSPERGSVSSSPVMPVLGRRRRRQPEGNSESKDEASSKGVAANRTELCGVVTPSGNPGACSATVAPATPVEPLLSSGQDTRTTADENGHGEDPGTNAAAAASPVTVADPAEVGERSCPVLRAPLNRTKHRERQLSFDVEASPPLQSDHSPDKHRTLFSEPGQRCVERKRRKIAMECDLDGTAGLKENDDVKLSSTITAKEISVAATEFWQRRAARSREQHLEAASRLNSELASVRSNSDSLTSELGSLRAHIAKLNGHIERAPAEAARAAQVAKLSAERQAKVVHDAQALSVNGLKQTLTKLRLQLGTAALQHSAAEAETSKLREDLATLRNALTGLKSTQAATETQAQQTHRQLVGAENEAMQLQWRLQQQSAENLRLERQGAQTGEVVREAVARAKHQSEAWQLRISQRLSALDNKLVSVDLKRRQLRQHLLQRSPVRTIERRPAATATATAAVQPQLCVVCYATEISVAFVPCGHRSVCENCGQSLSRCPVCRVQISQRLRTYDVGFEM